jgi:class 3 adenylate cyclase
MRTVAITASRDLASPPTEVWRFVSDTDRTNRVIGASPVEYEPAPDDAPTSARFVASTRAGAFTLRYQELPFEWSRGRELRVVRNMVGGVLESYVLTWSLAPSTALPGGTRVTLRLELTPRVGVLRPAVWLQGRQIVHRLVAFAESIDEHLRDGAPSPFAMEAPNVDERALAQGVDALVKNGVREATARRVARHVIEAGDADLVRIRPFELADALGDDRREVLRAMLHGVQAGLFELRWAIICPSCVTASEIKQQLEEIKPEGHCQLCDISFDLELDRAVEATFVPHEAVRKVPPRLFCIGGPARTPHVWSQTNVEPGQTRSLDAPTEPGRYRLFVRGGATGSVEVEPSAPREAQAKAVEGHVVPAELHVAPGGAIAVTNETRSARHVKVERLGYASAAATAHDLSMSPEFRRLFSRDLLKKGTPLKVTRVAILFSDLTGSTALYTKVGDAAAFRLVDDHFDVLREAIAAEDGVLVKTMGDAVLAAFRDPGACVRAAVDALGRFERFRAAREHGDLVGLKLGAYAGPCYVVSANGQLDYFGQTVNVASRVQHLADSGQLVVPRDLAESIGEPGKALRLVERMEARVKGVDAPLDLVRLAVAPPAARAERTAEPRAGIEQGDTR